MIVGHGIDIMSTRRIAGAIDRFGERFLHRVYTEGERGRAERRGVLAVQTYTAYWAAKEAAMKALGTGNRKGVRFIDIEVDHEDSGKPVLHLSGEARLFAERLGVNNVVVSMSHLDDLAAASVIFEKTPEGEPE